KPPSIRSRWPPRHPALWSHERYLAAKKSLPAETGRLGRCFSFGGLLQLDLAEAQIGEIIHPLGPLGRHRGGVLGIPGAVAALRDAGRPRPTTATPVPTPAATAIAGPASRALPTAGCTAAAGPTAPALGGGVLSIGGGGVDYHTAVLALALALAAQTLH